MSRITASAESVLAPVRLNCPAALAPVLRNSSVPLPETACATANADAVSARKKRRVAPEAMLAEVEAESAPVVPPLPTCRTPAETVVAPVYVLFALTIVVPLPDWVRVPVPLMTFENVWFAEVFTTNAPLFEMVAA